MVPGQEGRLASRQIQAFIGSIVNKTLKILIHLDFKHWDEIYLRSRIMLVMAHQTFQLNVKIFAQLYQVKIQGAVDTTIFKHSIVWPGWKKQRKAKECRNSSPLKETAFTNYFYLNFYTKIINWRGEIIFQNQTSRKYFQIKHKLLLPKYFVSR